MGDRGNIVIEPTVSCFPAPLYMYTHWSGSEIRTVLQDALKAGKDRWDDPQYLSRIIFNHLTEDAHDQIAGFGLSTAMCDNEHNLMCVDCKTATVREIARPPWDSQSDPLSGAEVGRWTFAEYIAADLVPDEDEENED